MNMFRAPLIAGAVLAMTSCATFAQVRIITPDSEHLYSTDPRTPGQQLPDDETLRLQNERAERAKILRQREREDAMRQQELDAAAAARQPPQSIISHMAHKMDHTTLERFAAGRVDPLSCGGLAPAPFRATRCNSDMRMHEYVADEKTRRR